MKQQVPEEFSKWHSIFRSREKQIPDNLKNQLLFIASKIFDQPFDTSTLTAQNIEQTQELARSGKRALMILFKTLVKAFLHEKQKVEVECKVKLNGFFEFWKEAKVLVSDDQMSFSSENYVTNYDLNQISILNCRASKKCFDVVFKSKTVAFVRCFTIQAFNELTDLIQSKIDNNAATHLKSRSSIKNITKTSNQISSEKVVAEKITAEEESKFRKSNSSHSQSRKEVKEINYIELLKGKNLQGYQIMHQTQNMFIFSSKTEPKIHVSMIISTQIQLEKVLNFYLHQKEWNSLIATEKVTQLEENIFQVFKVFRKDSFFQYERAVFTKVAIFCTKNTAYLTEESEKIEKKEGKLLCDIKSNVKLCKFPEGVTMNIDCSFDAKGSYNSQESTLYLQKLYLDIKFFENNLKINQLQSTKLKMLVVPTKNMQPFSDKQPYLKNFAFQTDSSMNNSIGNEGTTDSLDSFMKNQKQAKASEFSKLRPLKPYLMPSMGYIGLVLNNQNQKYYLRRRFDQSIIRKYDDYIPPYCLSELLNNKEYKISKKKELVYIDQEVIRGQKNSLLYVIRQVGANLISGKTVLNVSLPVDIFEPRSLLERSAACFGMAPDYLIPVANSDPLTQIKSIVTLFAHIPTLELVMLKPFNPILGETFQAYIRGIPIYYEQISHHPPISSFYMTCPEFTMYGNLVAFADVSINSAVGGNEGITYIKMRNGSQFQCYFPPCEIDGLVVGSRTFRAYGKGFVLQKNHNILAEISIEKDKKGLYEKGDEKLYPGDLIGGIFKVDPKIMKYLAKQPTLKKFSGLESKNVEAKLAHIRGTWFEEIRIDEEVTNRGKKIYPLEYPQTVLPSDSNFRLDILHHKFKDITQSQCYKEILETRQRGDKKLRDKLAKYLKKQLC